MGHRVILIPGDGTGPELTEATRRVVEATGVDFDWDVQPAGKEVMHEHGGNPLPDGTLESIRTNGVALKGPITTPIGGGFRSVNVALRKSLDLYAQVRPCKTYPGVRTRFEDVVRERIAAVLLHHVGPGLADIPVELHAGRLEHAAGRLGQLGPGAVAGDQDHAVGHPRSAPYRYIPAR